jgi:hypothetical protein
MRVGIKPFMPYRLALGDHWTEAKVARALIAAWRENPHTPEAAAFLAHVPLLLVQHPDERIALHLRSFSFARLSEARRSEARRSDLLKAYDLPRATFEARWRRGVRLLTEALDRVLVPSVVRA